MYATAFVVLAALSTCAIIFENVRIPLLIAVLVIGDTGGGAQRWIDLKVITIQPSEIAKMALVMVLGLAACGGNNGGEDEKVDLKVGFIFLHDEQSTYDKNFLEAVDKANKYIDDAKPWALAKDESKKEDNNNQKKNKKTDEAKKKSDKWISDARNSNLEYKKKINE